MTARHCTVPHYDGTRLGHDLAVEFPEETARIDRELARLAEPKDGLRVNAANLQGDQFDSAAEARAVADVAAALAVPTRTAAEVAE